MSDWAGLQFGLQFNAVRRRPQRTDRGRWSSLNRSGRPRSEQLMRLGLLCPPRLIPSLVDAVRQGPPGH